MARRAVRTTDAAPGDAADAAAGVRASTPARDADIDRLKARATHDREELTERLEDLADPLRDRLRKPVTTVNGWWKWVSALKPYRVWNQFSHNDGNLRTAGMSYQSLFAVFAGIWVAFSVAGVWLTANPHLMTALVDIINDAIPGLISTPDEKGVISQQTLTGLGTSFGWTSLIAAVGLIWTAIAWLYYTRQAVRAMFDLDRDERNYVLQKITDFGLAILFGVVLIISAAVTVITTDAMTSLLDLAGIGSDSFWANFLGRVTGFAVSIALNYIVLVAMYRVLSRVVIPWRYLVVGPLLGAAALVGLSVLSGLLLGGATKNPLLVNFAVFVGMLLLFNWICRVILLSAAWIAVGMLEHGIEPRRRTPEQIAYEKALSEYTAHMVIAQTAVEEAEKRAAAARGFAKWFANRRLRDARDELERVTDQPKPQPPKKQSWWLAVPDAQPLAEGPSGGVSATDDVSKSGGSKGGSSPAEGSELRRRASKAERSAQEIGRRERPAAPEAETDHATARQRRRRE
ncbi:YihY/virulence factor BrkB family protein [Humibacter ginsenosidimutans]|uniref:YihY/virulence factor BrkB family protein n=1 Tax=Humibacter ginsenosidimutans TaxID=2599293 RepID=A0A5B8MA67_9MICO|nr:YihY/virulence factor BrkB family protein [Humibacter ginsenosidimutans]QDZ16380.1 YihY/virulence factor BrkB family protein [Humibacter ginsenosidimutans]